MASGQTLLVLNAISGVPPASGFAALDSRNGHAVLAFDDTGDESVDFESLLPRNYAGAGLTVAIVWLAATATTGNVRWDVSFERHQDETTDLDTDSFAAAQSVTSGAPSVNGSPQYAEISFTDGAQIDGLVAGESFRVRVLRDADNVADTMVGDAQLMRLEIRET